MRAAETGRHIVIEKPVGVTLDDSLAIRDAVARAGVKTVTSFVLRWNPQFLTVKQLIADGVLGDLVYGEADYWHPLQDLYPGYRSFVSQGPGSERLRVRRLPRGRHPPLPRRRDRRGLGVLGCRSA